MLDTATVGNFATAIAIGALIGLEREKRKADENPEGIAGLRTFILVAVVGAIGGWLSLRFDTAIFFGGALLSVAAIVVAGYVMAARNDPGSLGLTTEVAVFAVCLLAGLSTLDHRELAIGLAVVTAAVLAYKQSLHGLVDKIGWDDVHAGLRLAIASFIVLPLLPREAIDPLGALKPYSLWLLVILISSLSLIGYVATRWLGSARGTALTALSGGLVSSTAVTLSFSKQSREDSSPAMGFVLASGILIAWGVMFGRVLVEVMVVNAALLPRVLVPFTAMALASAVVAVVFYRSGGSAAQSGQKSEVPLKNPFSLTAAIKFGAFFAVILVVVKAVQKFFPGEGFYLVAALAGLTDVDAITLSMAEYAKTGDAEIAVRSIVIAALANTLVKCVLAASLGTAELRRGIVIATGAILLAGGGAVLLM